MGVSFMESAHPNLSHSRVLIADDHAIFGDTLRAYIEKTYTVIGVVVDGRAMVQEAIRLKPDVVVADIGMPLLNGMDAARRIREQAPRMKFVFLTMHDDANLAAAILVELGRVGFVLKNSGGLELIKAIEEILHGRSYLTPKLRAEDWVAAKAGCVSFQRN
jgi:DNA-binding NarL/FixJ family response regulator